MVTRQGWRLAFCGALVACNVSEASKATPVHLDAGGGDDGGVALAVDGGMGDGGGVARTCPSALVVASSDYKSTNISVLSAVSGGLLSESIISSGSAVPGLSAALSGDVILPLATTQGAVVLVDQTNAVLTWVDPSTASAVNQLNVGTGFSSNPHDYLELSATKAYVTRYESNMSAGKQPNDGGGDLLIVNPDAATITGRVPFASDGAFLPRPDRMMRVGSDVWVLLDRFDVSGYMTAGDARIVGVSTIDDTIAWTLDLPGVANCTSVAIAPSGQAVALSCTGVLSDADPKLRSAIVLLDATMRPPVEIKRFAAATQLGAPLGFTLAYASETLLVGVALGDTMAGRNDVAYTLDLTAGTVQPLADAGAAFVFGDVRCAPGCTDLCFLADANTNMLRVWKANGSSLDAQSSVPVDPTIGLPPRSLGTF
jgi:hypothetical protein